MLLMAATSLERCLFFLKAQISDYLILAVVLVFLPFKDSDSLGRFCPSRHLSCCLSRYRLGIGISFLD